MNKTKPIQIYNNYVHFPKIDKFSKQFFGKTLYIFKGKSRSIKLNFTPPLDEEIKAFIKDKEIITNLNFSENIIKTLSKKL